MTDPAPTVDLPALLGETPPEQLVEIRDAIPLSFGHSEFLNVTPAAPEEKSREQPLENVPVVEDWDHLGKTEMDSTANIEDLIDRADSDDEFLDSPNKTFEAESQSGHSKSGVLSSIEMTAHSTYDYEVASEKNSSKDLDAGKKVSDLKSKLEKSLSFNPSGQIPSEVRVKYSGGVDSSSVSVSVPSSSENPHRKIITPSLSITKSLDLATPQGKGKSTSSLMKRLGTALGVKKKEVQPDVQDDDTEPSRSKSRGDHPRAIDSTNYGWNKDNALFASIVKELRQKQKALLSPEESISSESHDPIDKKHESQTSGTMQTPAKTKEAKAREDAIERSAAAEELLSTEIRYVQVLEHLHHDLIRWLRAYCSAGVKPIVVKEDINNMFPAWGDIYNVHKKLLTELQESHAHGKLEHQVAEILVRYCPFFRVYQPYVYHFASAQKMMKSERKRNMDFDRFVKVFEFLEEETIESSLIKPIQRIPRYELLFSRMKKSFRSVDLSIPENFAFERKVDEALSNVNAISKQLEDFMHMSEARAKVVEIQEKIFKSKVTFVKPTRYCVRIGTLKKYYGSWHADDDPNAKVRKARSREYLFILFNDMLLYSTLPE